MKAWFPINMSAVPRGALRVTWPGGSVLDGRVTMATGCYGHQFLVVDLPEGESRDVLGESVDIELPDGSSVTERILELEESEELGRQACLALFGPADEKE